MSLLEDQISIIGKSAETIFDIGTHTGESSKDYLDNFPSAKVFGFEGDATNFRRANALLKDFTRSKFFKDSARAKLFNVAVSDKDGRSVFHQSVHSAAHFLLPIWSSEFMDGDGHEVGIVTVETRSLDSIATEHDVRRIDILKMDIQGGELNALKGAINLLSKKAIRLVALEVMFKPMYHGQPQFWEIGRFFEHFGYSFYKLYDVKHHAKNSNVICWADAVSLSPELIEIK